MTDLELTALVALVAANTATENGEVATYGQLMTERDRSGLLALRNELVRRGVVPANISPTPVDDTESPF